jgi:uncharacterized LabA/DUF88 family protein
VGKNVAVFVDVANIFYAAKAAGTDIDYVTLLQAATAGRDFVRAYAYTGLDPDNENQRNFHAFLARNHYKVVSKDIRKYGDGKVKANLDIELVVDLMKTARNLDIAIVISGDGDFAPAIRAVQEMGVRVEVISFRGNTSSDLIEVADLFTDITQLARVDKTSSRSGRRVAGDQEDLSMTEVPDKITEGTGQRGRGRGRGRGRAGEAEPVAARGRTGSRSVGRESTSVAAVAAAPIAAPSGNGALTVLPGEKLSRVRPAAAATPAPEGMTDIEEFDEELTPFDAAAAAATADAGGPDRGPDDAEGEGEGDARRRRRRRGGRGRGRGRGRDGEVLSTADGDVAAGPVELDDEDIEDSGAEPIAAPPAAPRGPRTTPFGSVWDSQIGTPTSAPASLGPVADDEDFEEPEIPEYLIAEQRRGQQGGRGGQGNRGGARGGRAAYTAAIDRERYGRGGGGGGINRYPDVSGGREVSERERQIQGGGGGGGRSSGGGQRQGGGYGRQDSSYARQDAGYSRGGGGDRVDRPVAPRSGDPWSEVPPELEEMLRAQLAQSPKGRRPAPTPSTSRIEAAGAAGEIETMTESAPEAETAAPKRRATTRRKPAEANLEAAAGDAAVTPVAADEATTAGAAAPKRRTTRKKVDAADVAPASAAEAVAPAIDEAASAAPKRRTTTRKKAEAPAGADAGPTDAAVAEVDAPAAPKRRATRKKAEPA